jgi:hypothetical protein
MTNFAKLTGFVMLAVAGSVSATCTNIVDSIPYCNEVPSITYDNVGFSGSYQAVSYMNSETCECKFTPKPFSGPLAPLDEELSMHFRGPIKVKKIAVYQPRGSAKKRSEHLKRHQHHAKRRAAETTTTTVTSTVTVVWEEPTGSAKVDDDFKGKAVEDFKGKTENESSESESDKPSPAPVVKPPKQKEPIQEETGDGEFTRVGYWSDEGESNGLTFMNHRGGQGSGVFDYCWGNSISYADKTLQSGSAKPQIPDAIDLDSNQEFIVMSNTPCAEGDGCGYHLPGIPAYHGFGGGKKIFAFEFSMPEGGAGGFNGNMPAVWLLNANIPKTAQYGACSCWDTGCGELDVFEVLQGKHDSVKTHYHSKQGANGGKYGGGGSPDFFKRPYNKTIRVAVHFNGSKAVKIQVLSDSTNFGPTTSGFDGGDFSALSSDVKGSVFSVPS